MDSNSIENQEIKRKFVDREVYYCASFLISELAKNETYLDELMEVCMKDDWEGPAQDYIRDVSEDDCIDYLHDIDIKTKGKRIKALRKAVFENIDEDTAQDFCEDHNLDPYTVEALEHWIVSEWLAEKLEEKGEMILHDFLGLTIWGRTRSGQAILLDGVISEICSDMEILDGQANSWGPPKESTEPLTKRLRQVRDALNKTKNRAVIEEIANILNI